MKEAIEQFLLALVLERGMSKNTYDAYSRDLEQFHEYLKTCGKNCLNEVTRDDIVGFLAAERGRGMKGSTRARKSAAIRVFFRFTKERKLTNGNPAELLDPAKKTLALPRVLSEDEVFKMLDAIDGSDVRSLRDRAMLEVMYGCGLRVSETCNLQIGDLIGDGELLRVLGKGSKERVVPIGGAAGRALLKYCQFARDMLTGGNANETHIFATRLGRKFTRQGIFKIIKARAADVGIAAGKISPHVLRHCCASHMLAHGADIRYIQEMLGHADIGTTQIYTHIDTSRFGEMHRKYHPRA